MDKYNIVSRKSEIKFYVEKSDYSDLIEYCSLNKLNIEDVISKSFKTGFNIERYGLLNGQVNQEEIIKYVEIEKPVEVIKEVPVEKEVIKYIEVEKPIEVIKYITDDEKINSLISELNRVKSENLELNQNISMIKNQPTNDHKIELLEKTVQELKQDNEEKDKLIKQLQNDQMEFLKVIQDKRAVFMKNSNLDNKLYK
jgi:hypothetical protein